MTLVGFEWGPWWAAGCCQMCLASQPGPSNTCRSSLAAAGTLHRQDSSKHPHGETLGRHSQPQGRTTAEAKSPPLLEPADSTIHPQHPKLPSGHPWFRVRDWNHTGFDVTGSIFWHCTHLSTSASVNLLKEVKVLPRELKADHTWTSTI